MKTAVLLRTAANGFVLSLWMTCVAAGCMSYSGDDESPTWWDNPHKHDAEHLYFKAKGEGTTVEDARQNAFKSIQTQVSEYVSTQIHIASGAGGAAKTDFGSRLDLRAVESYDEKEAQNRGGWSVWMLGRYPRAEYESVKRRLEVADQLERQWNEARSAIDRQSYSEAEEALLRILDHYDSASGLSFMRENVKLELARLCIGSERILRARQWLMDVLNSGVDKNVRIRAESLLAQLPQATVGDAFQGRKVALGCMVRRDGKSSPVPMFEQEFCARLAKERVETLPLFRINAEGRDPFDGATIRDWASAARSQGADALFLILLDVDSSRTGQKIDIPFSNAKGDALDAQLRYSIVRAADGKVLAADMTSGYASNPSHMLTVILTHQRHLPKYAAQVASGLSKTSVRR
jgi:hypothetical protein